MFKRFVLPVCLLLFAQSTQAQNWLWQVQLGAAGDDHSRTASADGAGGVYVAGSTTGNLAGPATGPRSAWLARYDSTGKQQWIRQIATKDDDSAWATAPDGQGGVFVGGTTSGDLAGLNAGQTDAWLARYTGTGNQLWVRQFGTFGDERVQGASPDGSGGVYLSGPTFGDLAGPNAGGQDGFVGRFDGAGNQLWLRQLGTPGTDNVLAVEADGAGRVFLGGGTAGNLGATNAGSLDAFCALFDGGGNQLWMRQIGSSELEYVLDLALDDAGGVYLTMTTQGSLGGPSAGGLDGCLARYKANGKLRWLRQLGTNDDEFTSGAVPDGSGGVFMTGSTSGALAGTNPVIGFDPFVAHYGSTGIQVSVGQLITPDWELTFGSAADDNGGVFLAGEVLGAAGYDAWLGRYAESCASVASYCAAGISSSGCQPTLGGSGVPSASLGSGFTVTAANVEGARDGIFFYGLNGRQAKPWGNGTSTFCLVPPVKRGGPLAPVGTSGVCDGYFSQDLNARWQGRPNHNPGAGAVVQVQLWYLDPLNTSNRASSLSDALELCVEP